MEVSVPEKGDVYVDILNSNGELVWRLEADGLNQANMRWYGMDSHNQVFTTYM